MNQEDSHDEKVCNPHYANFLLLHLRIFTDLIIGEAANPLSLDHHFLQVYITSLMPRGQMIKVTTKLRFRLMCIFIGIYPSFDTTKILPH